ncbi:BACK domain-containing protein [bacterium]|nr:BACK domain-containing protein [bacterium]
MRESSCASVDLDPSVPAACVQSLQEGLDEELVGAADQLEFLSVLPILTPRLVATVTAENCCNCLTLATRRSLGELTTRAVQAADEHFEQLTASRAFEPLPEEALAAFLQCETLTTLYVVRLYEMLVSWHAHDAASRSFDALLGHISLVDLGVK